MMDNTSGQDLLHILLEKLPVEEDGRIIPRYLDITNALQPGALARFTAQPVETGDDVALEISPLQQVPGWILFAGEILTLPEEIQSSLRVSVRLLGMILENRQKQPLADTGAETDGEQYPLDNQDLISSASEGIIVYDRNLRYRVWNRYMEELTGLASAEVVGKFALDLFPHLRQYGIDRLIRQALAGETVNSPDTPYAVPATGKNGWVSSTYQPYHNPQGQVTGVVGHIRDITSRKQTEQELQESQRFAQQIIDTTPNLIYIYDLEDGRLVYHNSGVQRVLGFSTEELAQFDDQLLQKIMRPEDFDRTMRHRKEFQGRSIGDMIEVDYQVQHADGYWVMLHSRELLFSVTADGQPKQILGTAEDITEHRKAEEALRESEERYSLAVGGANDGIWDWDLKTGRVYYSQRWKSIIGYQNDPLEERIDEWFNRIHPGDYWQFKADVSAHLNGETPHMEAEHRILHKDGQYRWVLARGMAVRDAEGKAYRVAGSLSDITRQKVTEDRLRHDAMHDPLTHLPNRAYFIDQVRRAIDRARRNNDYQGAVLYLDLDRFKLINESLGHQSGDLLLVAIARRLQALIRPRDLVSRFGGDEFAILLDDISGVGDATRIAQRIQEELAFPYKIQDHEVYPGASIGIAIISTSSIRAEDLLRDADTAMYRAKAGGRGRHQVFGTEMHAMNVALFELEAELRHAVERKQFQLYYQPIVTLEDGKINSVEALLRWHHPRRGLILPGEFIILAEETGLILPIGEWVLRTACQQARAWHGAGFTGLSVAVNISARQMQDQDLPALVREVLKETGLPAGFLQLEITEWAAMQNLDLTVKILNELRDMGVYLSIDDFGTSYSSLGYLKHFPISAIKIDQSFVRDMTEDVDDAAITRAIIAMGNVLGLSVVAEGIEMEQQLAMLVPEKCSEVQGDLLGRPVPGEAITALLQEGHTLLPEIGIPGTGKKRPRIKGQPPARGSQK